MRLQDLKEKLSDVHISVIEITQAIEGRKYEDAKTKFDDFVKLALHTQRDFEVFLRSGPAGEDQHSALDQAESGGQSSSAGAQASTVRRGSVQLNPEEGGDEEAYVPSTSANARGDSDKAAILQAIKDLGLKSSLGAKTEGGDSLAELRRKDDKSSPRAAALVEQLATMDSDFSASSACYVPMTSVNVREELDRAAVSMAESEYGNQKMKKETPEHFEESDCGSDSEQVATKAETREPYGGPMNFKLKSNYVQDWLSTSDHNLEDLLERRSSGFDLKPPG
ncbi:hypothetical protein A3770_01p00030 [Chloropicon primus]|uniref:Uncharacterized protein n=1 Tax=Chloropicon primus TaxID=1764295 RepID=A0A5B8MD09_9CHLO|nr:hypothetical protein A3770_01p00030 [Chloropicon primus]|mmetsp:Transcript_12237/g.34004  ORF Transcript_12237/g.34004 Transcript_12237/m.34004 type:complete len:280 (+) Transcript_12237:1249-2088(+)|eukprot:QDZ17485.1 hypothetical protein A3770_01p00030 [Chloropicon primus]